MNWQEILLLLIKVIILIITPIILLFLRKFLIYLEQKYQIELKKNEQALLEQFIHEGIAFAEEWAKQKIKAGKGKPLPEEKLREAEIFVINRLICADMKKLIGDYITKVIEAILYQSRDDKHNEK